MLENTFFALSVAPADALQWLIEVVVKGTVVLLLAAALAQMLKHWSAALRHLMWSVAVIAVLLLPMLELILPQWKLPVLPTFVQTTSAEIADEKHSADDAGISTTLSLAESDKAVRNPNPASSLKDLPANKAATRKTFDELPMTPPFTTPLFEDVQPQAAVATASTKTQWNWAMMLASLWALGFGLVVMRLLAGSLTMWRIVRHAENLSNGRWQRLTKEIAKELGLQQKIRLVSSERVRMPMTWGVWRPVVLLPEEAGEWSVECRRIVLLHELAHIKRRDCLTQMLAQLACAIYWFNPLVWSAAKRLRVERELACDDQVLAIGTRASDYAGHLLEIASAFEAGFFASPMTVGMACSQLEQRVVAILNPNLKRRSLTRGKVILAGVMAACLMVPMAVVQPWVRAATLLPEVSPLVDSTSSISETSGSEQQVEADISRLVEPQTRKMIAATVNHEAHSEQPENKSEQIEIPIAQEISETFTSELEAQEKNAAAQNDQRHANHPDEESRRLKVFGITPEFIESARRLGFDNLSVNQLVQMRVHKIDEEFVRQARSWGFDNLTLNQLIQLRIAGVNADYIEAMKRAGFTNLSVNRLANLKMHNVTPAFIEEMRRLGFANLSAERLLSLKIHNINEAFIKETENWGFGKLSVEELMRVRVHRLTPDFANEMRALGFNNLTFNQLLQLKMLNVNAEFMNEMRGLGLSNLSVEQVMQMKRYGINADYVRRLRAAGFKNVSVNQMIDMKLHHIDDILLKSSK